MPELLPLPDAVLLFSDDIRTVSYTHLLWLENDGFEYPFQMDYEKGWKQIVEAIREVADYAPDMKYSIEYKPYEERSFAMVRCV